MIASICMSQRTVQAALFLLRSVLFWWIFSPRQPSPWRGASVSWPPWPTPTSVGWPSVGRRRRWPGGDLGSLVVTAVWVLTPTWTCEEGHGDTDVAWYLVAHHHHPGDVEEPHLPSGVTMWREETRTCLLLVVRLVTADMRQLAMLAAIITTSHTSSLAGRDWQVFLQCFYQIFPRKQWKLDFRLVLVGMVWMVRLSNDKMVCCHKVSLATFV